MFVLRKSDDQNRFVKELFVFLFISEFILFIYLFILSLIRSEPLQKDENLLMMPFCSLSFMHDFPVSRVTVH